MAVIESPETVGIRPFHEFDEANSLWPRGQRLDAIRTAAEQFRKRFKAQGEIRAVRTVDLVSAGYPVKFAFGGTAKAVNPFINIRNRLVVVQFENFEGETKTLVWEPTVPEGSREAPFYAQLAEKYGETFEKIGAKYFNSVGEALAKVGLKPDDVDYVSFDHLHVQDMRRLMGTTKPVDGESLPKEPFFPNAKFLCQRKEVDTFASLHPMQWAWYVPGGMDDVIEDNLVLIDGDVELGIGVALVWTPGHTDGNQSLCINTPDGVWVSSENGVCADNWHPHLSKIPGVKAQAEFFNREVILNSNTLEDSIDQYDSMVKEKCLADANRDDPRFFNVFPSSEMESWRRQWPVVPTFVFGGMNYGVLQLSSFGAKAKLGDYEIFRLDSLQADYDVARLPYSLKILLENLLRTEDGENVTAQHIEAIAKWVATDEPSQEIAFTPARVLMQDFTGVPAIVDLASMRDAIDDLGGDAAKINPLAPAELIIDHSIQVDHFAEKLAFKHNAELEFERNYERYAFLRWGQSAFADFKVVPPNTGICHQVNLEYLARVVFTKDGQAYPDTLVGTDSHTTMINGLGVLGWGVGGIEAEAAMLGQPISMLIPQVVGFKLTGELPEGATATDLVLTVTQMLREKGVVGKFVEYFGEGLANLPLADRATIGNMSPEYGATCGIFPVDKETLRYLEFTGRPKELVDLVEAYTKEQGLFHEEGADEATYSDTLELDLSTVEPSLAGPKRPQDRVALSEAAESYHAALNEMIGSGNGKPQNGTPDEASWESFPASDPPAPGTRMEAEGDPNPHPGAPTAVAEADPARAVVKTADGQEFELGHGAVVIAAITSCTNTSNPSVMLGAGLLAKKAVERGLAQKPWVKTSLAPGSKVVTEYLERSGLDKPLVELGFDLVGYGCTTCIGNSGPLPEAISEAIEESNLVVCSVLSGNRNFEGRIHPEVKMNYLASPPLCVAYALAGRMDVDIVNEPIGQGSDGEDVYLRDIWPSQEEVNAAIESAVESEMFRRSYGDTLFEGDDNWKDIDIPEGDRYEWQDDSTYVRRAPYFEGMSQEPSEGFERVENARILCLLGDSVTTDHISPAGAFREDTPAGKYLREHGVEKKDFNSYGSRRGNHEVMMRGTFANVRLRNLLAPGTEGGFTLHLPDEEELTIFDAAVKYADEGVPLGVLAGKEYGSGSSRDWAAKGPRLLGVRFVIAESYERIHRSNLVGMGILPLQFPDGESVESLGLTGKETYTLAPLEDGAKTLKVSADDTEFEARVRIDTPNEWQYYRHGGILHYVLRRMLRDAS